MSVAVFLSEHGRALAASALVAVLALLIRRLRSANRATHAGSNLNRSTDFKLGAVAAASASGARDAQREPGEWIPVQFDYPRVEPETADISTVKPIPYRPFRWGEYHVTMGIRSMPSNEWIEIDQQFFDYHKIVGYRIKTRGDRAVKINDAQPGIVGSGHAAAQEFVHELAEYLSQRYPALYQAVRKEKDTSGWYGQGEIKTITIIPLQETYDLDEQDPLIVASLLTQEDYTIMIEGTDGRYYLQAGAICIPGFWRLEDKLGMPLDEIHLTGNVPHYQSKLHLSMGRFFRRLPVDKPVVRNNYSFQVVRPPAPAADTDTGADALAAVDPTELAWSRTMHGSEDGAAFERSAVIRGTLAPSNQLAHAHASPEGKDEKRERTKVPLDPQTVYLRTERQTLRRLPRTGGIVFTIRVYQTPVVQLAQEPGVPGRLASSVRGWSEEVAQYKDLFAYEDILEYLDKCHAEQVQTGFVKPDERISAYPM
ncbi:hypothetical protein IEO21_08185 [Rhodonia placenta]|uniref:Uncharacterized protein n=1 Tax=Rhodonia placenta TaxID=104341 RepID=A0A8H7TZM7_9APHY|nr:hypothetical protein IEO21_08185 [Postia placenta]